MNKNKGFTLVELLGVVVVLVMILLIAIPTINRLRDETKRKAFENSAYGIIKAGDLYYSRKEMMGEELEDTLFEFPNNIGKLEFSGDIPKSGSMLVTDSGEIGLAISNGKYCITKEFGSRDIKVTKNVDECKFRIDKLSLLATTETGVNIPACVTNKTICESGELVAIKVNDKDIYNFYVIADNNSEVTLIMDRNLVDYAQWISTSDYTKISTDNTICEESACNDKGPITALNRLNRETRNWDNIVPIGSYVYNNNLNGTTNEYGYQKLEIKNGIGKLTSQDAATIAEVEGISRVRLLTEEEVADLKTANNGTTPKYLYDNLSASIPYGYWLLTAVPTLSNYACNRNYAGGSDYNLTPVYISSLYGLRPVITLSK